MAIDLPTNKTTGSGSDVSPSNQATALITSGCNIQSPNRVIIKNRPNCFLALPVVDLKVNDLFTKKLHTKAIEVEIKLAAILSSPKKTRTNSMTKSSAVLAPPTTAKRSFSACFCSRFFMVILLNKIQRSLF